MQLVAIRHLETPWNAEGRLQGRIDIGILPPSQEMQASIDRQRELLVKLEFDAVFASRLQRTRQTAAQYGYAQPTLEGLLDELDFGDFEGRLRADLEAAEQGAWRTRPAALRLGEPVAALQQRIQAFLNQRCRGLERVLVFGHGAWLRALVAVSVYGDLNQMNQLKLEPGELISLEIVDGRARELRGLGGEASA